VGSINTKVTTQLAGATNLLKPYRFFFLQKQSGAENNTAAEFGCAGGSEFHLP